MGVGFPRCAHAEQVIFHLLLHLLHFHGLLFHFLVKPFEYAWINAAPFGLVYLVAKLVEPSAFLA